MLPRQAPPVVHVDPEIEDLIPGFLENRRRDLVRLRELLNVQDFESIRVLGHSLKGAGGGYGFDYLSQLGADLEVAGKQRRAPEVEAAMRGMADYLDRVKIIVDPE